MVGHGQLLPLVHTQIRAHHRPVAKLTDLLKDHPAAARPKSGARLQWLPAHQQAFEAIRLALASPQLLRLFDSQLPSRVEADSSGIALGSVLKQQFESVWHPVAYYSRKLSPAETRYTTRERECLAVKSAWLNGATICWELHSQWDQITRVYSGSAPRMSPHSLTGYFDGWGSSACLILSRGVFAWSRERDARLSVTTTSRGFTRH